MKTFQLFLFSILLSFIFSCNNNRLDIDISNVNIPAVNTLRLDQDMFTMDTSNIEASTSELNKKYDRFYATFVTGIINNGGMRDSSYASRMKRFLHDKDMHNAYLNCQTVYPNLDNLNDELTTAFKRFKYHFPKKSIPNTVAMMSGFNHATVFTNNTLAIGLEMYLGSENKFYKMLAYPSYKVAFMNKENIASDAIRTWMFSEFPYKMNKNDFLSEIIYLGKILYLNDALLPQTHDTIKMQYTTQQLDYCTANEFNVWTYFIAQKLLYTTDRTEITKFTGEGPFTSALSKESAPRIGYWTGLQIVRQFMNEHPEVTLQELMDLNDAQVILSKSKYKPKKS